MLENGDFLKVTRYHMKFQEVERNTVIPAIFNQLRQSMAFGNEEWSSLEVGGEGGDEEQNTYQFAWNPQSTYIR